MSNFLEIEHLPKNLRARLGMGLVCRGPKVDSHRVNAKWI